MKISEVQEILERYKKEDGDIEVKIAGPPGEEGLLFDASNIGLATGKKDELVLLIIV